MNTLAMANGYIYSMFVANRLLIRGMNLKKNLRYMVLLITRTLKIFHLARALMEHFLEGIIPFTLTQKNEEKSGSF